MPQWMLEYLYLTDVHHLHFSGIATPYLLASIDHSDDIHLNGTMNLRELDATWSRGIQIYWINSPILTVNMDDHSSALLSGTADFANMKLIESAKLDAKYLTVKRLFVKTRGEAKAEVTAAEALNALATDDSNIYYYHQPPLLSRYYQDQGAILYMGETPPPCTLPYCPVLPHVLPG